MQSGTLPNLEVEFVDLNDYEMLIYSIDRERQGGIQHEAQAFFDKIGTTNAIIVSFAEHNGSVTVAWKNIFDWMSRIEMKLWRGKPVVMLAAIPGPGAGAQLLKKPAGDSAVLWGRNLRNAWNWEMDRSMGY
jgi:NAD(P)H-dependent FMN reductase